MKKNPATQAGFTLIELMIVLAVVAILAAIAYPSFSAQVMKSKRQEAIAELADLALRQEKWRANNTTYGSLADITGAATRTTDHYSYAVSNNTASSYTLTATATGNQVEDKQGTVSCKVLTMDQNGDHGTTNAECW